MIEIERKFLVNTIPTRDLFQARAVFRIRQAYLPSSKGVTVRIRTREVMKDTSGLLPTQEAFITVKGPSSGISRAEYEYPISFNEAVAMMELRDWPIISKIRSEIKVGNHIWEVDSFLEENEGLILAEIELSAEDEEFEKPDWVGVEVTHDPKYSNARLAKNPFSKWTDSDSVALEMFNDIETLSKEDWDAILSVCDLEQDEDYHWHEFGDSGKGCMINGNTVMRPLEVFVDAMSLATSAKMRIDFKPNKVTAAITDGNNSVGVTRVLKDTESFVSSTIKSTRDRKYQLITCQAIVKAILEHHKRR